MAKKGKSKPYGRRYTESKHPVLTHKAKTSGAMMRFIRSHNKSNRRGGK